MYVQTQGIKYSKINNYSPPRKSLFPELEKVIMTKNTFFLPKSEVQVSCRRVRARVSFTTMREEDSFVALICFFSGPFSSLFYVFRDVQYHGSHSLIPASGHINPALHPAHVHIRLTHSEKIQ